MFRRNPVKSRVYFFIRNEFSFMKPIETNVLVRDKP